MSDYRTRDTLLAENELLREVIKQKNEIIRALELGPAGETRKARALYRLEELKSEMAEAETEAE